MDITQKLTLLGGISPQVFMKRHWQKKPLLVRQALPNFKALLNRGELFELAAKEDVQARMVIQEPGKTPGWRFRQGPFTRRALPSLKQAGWTLLVQGVDLQSEAVHQLMNQFRFVPDARLDDLMISFATDGGGVGPHYDSYDVFLLQAQGRRRWRIGRQKDLSLQPDVPLKILANFEPEVEYLLEPGDMLYLPPRYAHDEFPIALSWRASCWNDWPKRPRTRSVCVCTGTPISPPLRGRLKFLPRCLNLRKMPCKMPCRTLGRWRADWVNT